MNIMENILFVNDKNAIELADFIQTYRFKKQKTFVLCNPTTKQLCLPILEQLFQTDFSSSLIVLPIEESSKDITTVCQIWQSLLEKKADKNSILFCLGGGVLCDIGGFAASCFKRGIEYVLIPTTLMAQIDAAIGGKTAINFSNEKNQIGLFASSTKTIIFPKFLDTLPQEELLSAFAEMLKHGLITDKNYWNQLANIKHIEEIKQTNLILQSIQIKSKICSKDPQEKDERKKLNFGHTIGHAIESFMLKNNTIKTSHGHCIALGMLAETYLSQLNGLLSQKKCNIILQTLLSFFSIIDIKPQYYKQILSNIQFDKKRIGNNYNFTLLSDIGKAEINQQVEEKEIIKSLSFCFETLKK